MAAEPHILRGTRSSSDAQHHWKCMQCYNINKPKEGLLFDLPSFRCNGVLTSGDPCDAKYLGDFSISLADILVNGSSLLGDLDDVKKQHLNECIATAISSCLEITERVKRILKGRSINGIPVADANVLHSRCMDQTLADKLPFGINGLQDLVAMALRATTSGVKHEFGGGNYKMSSAGVINKYDVEQICEALANGYPMVCTFLSGKKLDELKYCQLYKPPSVAKFKRRNKPIAGHAAVIVGAGRHLIIEYVFFLNSHGKLFCCRVDEDGVVRKTGVGKIRLSDLLLNTIIFPRENEIVGQTSLVAQATTHLSQANKDAMIPSTSGSLDDFQLGFGGSVTGRDGDRSVGSDRVGADHKRDDRRCGRGGPVRSGESYQERPVPYDRPSRGALS